MAILPLCVRRWHKALVWAKGKPLGFNDDASDETLDPVLSGIELREDGAYTLVLSHANGGSEGDIALSLELHWRRGPGGR